MASKRSKEIDAFITVELESELYDLIEKYNDIQEHLEEAVPESLLYTTGGEPNTRSFWGVVLHHIIINRATLNNLLMPKQ